MSDHSVRISGDPWNPHVEVNGHDISASVRTVTIRYERDNLAEVSIELLAGTVELADLASEETKTVLSLPSDVEDTLTEFGWTPPNACAGGCR
jgi:hypothetical protein